MTALFVYYHTHVHHAVDYGSKQVLWISQIQDVRSNFWFSVVSGAATQCDAGNVRDCAYQKMDRDHHHYHHHHQKCK